LDVLYRERKKGRKEGFRNLNLFIASNLQDKKKKKKKEKLLDLCVELHKKTLNCFLLMEGTVLL